MLRLASFNIFWFGTADASIITRGADDEALIARVLRWIGADVLVLQEIVDVAALVRVLPEGLRIHEGGRLLCPTPPEQSDFANVQKIVLAVGSGVEVRSFGAFPGAWPGPRPPLVATLRSGGRELTVVGVHLKSGAIAGGPGEGPADVRSREAAALGAWLQGRARTVVAGDLNARAGAPSLAGLALPGWAWSDPARPPDPEGWTTWIDRSVIDHVVGSPDLPLRRAEVLAFDLDPAFADAALRVRTGFRAARLRGEPIGEVENLYRVSDHRPVRVEVA